MDMCTWGGKVRATEPPIERDWWNRLRIQVQEHPRTKISACFASLYHCGESHWSLRVFLPFIARLSNQHAEPQRHLRWRRWTSRKWSISRRRLKVFPRPLNNLKKKKKIYILRIYFLNLRCLHLLRPANCFFMFFLLSVNFRFRQNLRMRRVLGLQAICFPGSW